MKSARAKVLHQVAGAPILHWVLRTAAGLGPKTTTVVVGHQADEVKAAFSRENGISFVVQEPQRGTAHALLMAEPALRCQTGTLLLLYGDVPLLTATTVKQLLDRHLAAGAAATVLTAVVDNPYGYGRIIRSGERIARIVEERDASSAEREIREINSGIYAFALDGLFEAVRSIAADTAQGEHYLPDLVTIYQQRGRTVTTLTVPNADEILGINSRAELAEVSSIVRRRKNDELMAAGVTIQDPATTYIDDGVSMGADTIVHPGVSIEGATTIGAGCEIHSGVRIVDSSLGDRVVVYNHCVITQSRVADDA